MDQAQWDSLVAALPPGDTVHDVHTHSTRPGHLVYGYCTYTDKNGVERPIQRYPGDPNAPPRTAFNDALNGGGSLGDYHDTAISRYVVDTQGSIWHIPLGTGPEKRYDDWDKRKSPATAACGYK